MGLITKYGEDRWKDHTIGEIMEDDLKEIDWIMSFFQGSGWYKDKLEEMYKDVATQLSKSVSVGKLMQQMLLQYMTPAELKEKLRDGMLKIELAEKGEQHE